MYVGSTNRGERNLDDRLARAGSWNHTIFQSNIIRPSENQGLHNPFWSLIAYTRLYQNIRSRFHLGYLSRQNSPTSIVDTVIEITHLL